MPTNRSQPPGRMVVVTLGALIAGTTMLSFAEPAMAIPTFARKYRTSCITCHTVWPKLNHVGEAFRVNGYQFPADEDILVKDEPIPFGGEAYKDMFPDSIWPSDMPTLPPVWIRGQLRSIWHTDPAADGVKWDLDFPHEVVLGGAATFGPNIAAWYEIEWAPSEEAVEVERLFVTFSNLFAWSLDDDDDGMRQGYRWLTLPPRALNLRLGKLEPQVIPHVASQHARVGIQQALPIRQRIGANRFRFEPVQTAIEAYGVLRQYNSYVVGLANGGNNQALGEGGHLDDNTHKDFYFRVARKWWGYPLDGRIEAARQAEEGSDTAQGQNPDKDVIYNPPMGAFWRDLSFETGLFGWFGKSDIPFGFRGSPINFTDDFYRLGIDARYQIGDLDIYGLAYYGHDQYAGLLDPLGNPEEEGHFSYFIQADYMVKPWILAFIRYEETHFDEVARTNQEEGRLVPGAVFLIRQNMKLQAEVDIDTTGNDTGGAQRTDQVLVQLDFAY